MRTKQLALTFGPGDTAPVRNPTRISQAPGGRLVETGLGTGHDEPAGGR
ncbi:MAG: hypothetical protein NVS3B25_20700 [Hymenobacter sp.]